MVGEVEVLTLRIDARRAFSTEVWESRRHAFARATDGEEVGWGEVRIPQDAGEDWAERLAGLAGRAIGDARAWVSERLVSGDWTRRHAELAEMALLDLEGRRRGVPAIELLGLSGRAPVPALFAVLDDDPASARAKVEVARARGLGGYVKLKLFADDELDARLIEAVREVVPEAYLLGDLNRGYGREASSVPALGELTERLVALREAGLDGCEDPAALTPGGWVELQERVGELDLVPDHPMRPAREGLRLLRAGMGRMVNLHPGTLGLLADAADLGRRAQALGLRVMVGDDSLVGPGVAAWQQVAVGLGAAWVEAMMKPEEAPGVTGAIRSTASGLRSGGLVGYEPAAGWGVEVDLARVRELAVGRSVWDGGGAFGPFGLPGSFESPG